MSSFQSGIKFSIMGEGEHCLNLLGLLKQVKCDLDLRLGLLLFDVGKRSFQAQPEVDFLQSRS